MTQPAATFRELPLHGTYSPDDQPFATFYVPFLSSAVQYDRAVGYWSSAELRYAAQGTARFIAAGGRMRLIVGAQLHPGDVEAVTNGEPLDDVLVRRLLADPGLAGVQIVEDGLLQVLAWMVATDRLEIRVGVPTDGKRLLTHQESGKYFHTKFGVLEDAAGDRVAFNGSNNASVTSWSYNHETFDVYPSWNEGVWAWNGQAKVDDFEKLWSGDADPGWAVVPLPTAVREHLIVHAPDSAPFPPSDEPEVDPFLEPDVLTEPEPAVGEDLDAAWEELVALAQAPRRSRWTAAGTAAVVPLPHQARVVDKVVMSYPRGYLFADEVGLGKTVEAGLVLRELLVSGEASKALLLVPASVLVQWQEELHEKLNLDVPRYDKGVFRDRFGDEIPVSPGTNPWSAFPVVLASSHLARRKDRRSEILRAGPWDVVLVDEAHHARRRGAKPTETPNSLLALLTEMRDNKMWQALYLASATPMQMNPHEAWDLISLLGLHGRWAESAMMFQRYFRNLREDPTVRDWQVLSEMLGDYFTDPGAERDDDLESRIEDEVGPVDAYSITEMSTNPPSKDAIAQMPNATSHWMTNWARRHTPMRDRVFRNTRKTLRAYQKAGIIPPDVTIPVRHVEDAFIELTATERALYDRIEQYIRRHYNAYKGSSQQALGFIMTVYRRRLTSSFVAIERSLQRRLDVLEKGLSLGELLTDDDRRDTEENALFDPDLLDVSSGRLQDEISELRSFVADLGDLTGEDTKAHRLMGDVAEALKEYSSIVVFTQYTDTMDYVRDRLIAAGHTRLGCYSGRGGETYDTSSGSWELVTKSRIKTMFREGKLGVLIGTDSMSEGLNLQTSGRLVNYDMPWNLMRVEQRIGRVDRIGASYKDIRVTNYFYADTVEEQVYRGIREDFEDFTDIVGGASPVLASVERAIEQLAFGDPSRAAVRVEVGKIRHEVSELAKKDVQVADLGEPEDEVVGVPPELVGEVGLRQIEAVLTGNPLTAPLLEPDDDLIGVYRLRVPSLAIAWSFASDGGVKVATDYGATDDGDVGERIAVTFDRQVVELSAEDVVLLTYGTPELTALLPDASKT